MQSLKLKNIALGAALLAAASLPAQAAVFITEVDPSASGNTTYAADWFELTNAGALAVDITGWKMDDNSNSFASAVALRGVTSIAPGQSVVFIESNASGSNDAAVEAAFKSAWFGSNVPAGFVIGAYGGSGVGLSTGGDAVNVFDSGGALMAKVTFGSSTTGFTFDNAAELNNTAISQLSVLGVNGAFQAVDPLHPEIGSPGLIAAPVPEPETYALMLGGLALVGFARRRRQRQQNA